MILSDKEGNAGLVTNTDCIELGAVKIDPSIDDPVTAVVNKSQGDALFTFFLLLMQSLQSSEARVLSPDYLGYARVAGLGTVDVAIGKSGKDRLPLARAVEVITNASEHSDTEIVNSWYTCMVHAIQVNKNLFNPDGGVVFAIGEDRYVKSPRPHEVWESVLKFRSGKTTAEDTKNLAAIVELLRLVEKEKSHLGIVEVHGSILESKILDDRMDA